MGDFVKVQVVFTAPGRSMVADLQLRPGATVSDALDGVRQLEEFRGVVISEESVGIFGRLIQSDRILTDGDRVEIYRGLQVDPKELRRNRAK